MTVIQSLEELASETYAAVLGVGFFDGVHVGHQAVLARTRKRAADVGATCWALTFEPHPLAILTNAPPPRIASAEHKLILLERCGMDGCIVLPFTRELAAQPPEQFAESLVHRESAVSAVVAGTDWRFGRGGKGSADMLAAAGRTTGMEVDVVRAVAQGTDKISSTRIRTAIQTGDLDHAATMLGRPFSILGKVVHGEGIGRTLGFPSANLATGTEVLPPAGVYAVLAKVGDTLVPGALSSGHRPTFPELGGTLTVEVHLLDCSSDLYGTNIEVFFLSFLREEQRYDSRKALIAQISNDVIRTRELTTTHPRGAHVRDYLTRPTAPPRPAI